MVHPYTEVQAELLELDARRNVLIIVCHGKKYYFPLSLLTSEHGGISVVREDDSPLLQP